MSCAPAATVPQQLIIILLGLLISNEFSVWFMNFQLKKLSPKALETDPSLPRCPRLACHRGVVCLIFVYCSLNVNTHRDL